MPPCSKEHDRLNIPVFCRARFAVRLTPDVQRLPQCAAAPILKEQNVNHVPNFRKSIQVILGGTPTRHFLSLAALGLAGWTLGGGLGSDFQLSAAAKLAFALGIPVGGAEECEEIEVL